MTRFQGISKFFSLVFEPLRRNASFFVFMYVLGVTVNVLELAGKKDAVLTTTCGWSSS